MSKLDEETTAGRARISGALELGRAAWAPDGGAARAPDGGAARAPDGRATWAPDGQPIACCDSQPGGPGVRGDEAELFRCHHPTLVRAVARSVNASQELIEDACQSAWVVLLRLQPERTPTLFAWLRTVAVHEAYRLSRQEWRDARLEELADVDREWRLGDRKSFDEAIEARRALATLASLPERQREDLALVVGGYSYKEIARRGAAGARSVNNVNKRLTKARARIRRLEALA